MISKPLDNKALISKVVTRSVIDWECKLKVPKLSKKDIKYLEDTIPLKERYEHPP